KPTGSSDAYGLRRAALGLVRLILANEIRFSKTHADRSAPLLKATITLSAVRVMQQALLKHQDSATPEVLTVYLLDQQLQEDPNNLTVKIALDAAVARMRAADAASPLFALKTDMIELREDLLAFLADRLKVQLRDQGKRHDLVDA